MVICHIVQVFPDVAIEQQIHIVHGCIVDQPIQHCVIDSQVRQPIIQRIVVYMIDGSTPIINFFLFMFNNEAPQEYGLVFDTCLY